MRSGGFLIVAALAAACGGSVPAPPEAPSVTPPAPIRGPLAEILDDARSRGDGAPGEKVLLINVWATYCPPCREELPDLVALHEEHSGDGLRVVLVSADFGMPKRVLVKFLAEHGVGFQTYQQDGPFGELRRALQPEWDGAIPATFIHDGTGALRSWWIGKRTKAELEEKIREVSPAVLGAS